ncbi:MAG: hypothetical protein FWB96_10590 [Defluviitaleaceae bacterium]|nr:hypothetical protein [Defluviitaleaceae bacterium]MCL2263335.1 hypothetical protein [Defluviitaleaceae bacterium]
MNKTNINKNTCNENEKTLYALKATHLILVAKFFVTVGLVYFWVVHHYGVDYILFIRNYLLANEGFLTTQTFLIFFRAAIYIAIVRTSYSFFESLLPFSKLSLKLPTLPVYAGLLSVIFLVFWMLSALGTSTSNSAVVRAMLLGFASIFISWILSSFFLVTRNKSI